MAEIDIQSLFKAGSDTVMNTLRPSGTAFYIPAYQRPFSWNAGNIKRLFEDSTRGLVQLIEWEQSVTFLGTIIAIHDTSHQTVHPSVQGQLPEKVMVIIDGQQRLTCLLVINALIHNELFKLTSNLKKIDGPAPKWLAARIDEHLGELHQTLGVQKFSGDESHRFYPKMIRAIDDQWSSYAAEAKYASPISNFLFQYISYTIEPKGAFKYVPLVATGAKQAFTEVFSSAVKTAQSYVSKIINGSLEDIPPLSALINSEKVGNALFSQELPTNVVEYVETQSGEEKDYRTFERAFRLLTYCYFLNKRTALTVVTTTEEDYAFDMFESLNTTGEPLTAIETFKPKVTLAEELSKYEASESFGHMETIDDYLSDYPKADQRQKASSILLIPFSLAEEGYKLGNKLNEQRVFLRSRYDALDGIKSKRQFTEHLAQIANFLKHTWPPASAKRSSTFGQALENGDKLPLACMDLLNSMNHSVVLAPVSRFYSRFLAESDDQVKTRRLNELREAVLAVTAFSVLFRSSRKDTDNIDGIYRNLMQDGAEIATTGTAGSTTIPPFCRKPRDLKVVPSVNLLNLKRYLWNALQTKGEIRSAKDYAEKAKNVPVYKVSVPLARFLLFAAYHDSILDPHKPGQIKDGTPNSHNLLDKISWANQEALTVEHVAPQNPSEDWQKEFFDSTQLSHSLGNLTLLPAMENSVFGNRSWAEKRALFNAISQDDPDVRKGLLDELETEVAKSMTNRAKEIISTAEYRPIVKDLAQYDKDWTHQFVQERSEHLHLRVWQVLSVWLKP